MSYLLDTCVISELVKRRPDSLVVEWIAEQDENALYLSTITLGELFKGVAKLPESRRRSDISSWIEHALMQRFRNRILDVDLGVARIWGDMLGKAENQGRPLPAVDALIAATGIAHQLAVVTRNESDIGPTGVHVVNPWAP